MVSRFWLLSKFVATLINNILLNSILAGGKDVFVFDFLTNGWTGFFDRLVFVAVVLLEILQTFTVGTLGKTVQAAVLLAVFLLWVLRVLAAFVLAIDFREGEIDTFCA